MWCSFPSSLWGREELSRWEVKRDPSESALEFSSLLSSSSSSHYNLRHSHPVTFSPAFVLCSTPSPVFHKKHPPSVHVSLDFFLNLSSLYFFQFLSLSIPTSLSLSLSVEYWWAGDCTTLSPSSKQKRSCEDEQDTAHIWLLAVWPFLFLVIYWPCTPFCLVSTLGSTCPFAHLLLNCLPPLFLSVSTFIFFSVHNFLPQSFLTFFPLSF